MQEDSTQDGAQQPTPATEEVVAEPQDSGQVVGEDKPVGPATIVEMETPLEQFPEHNENA